MVRVRKRKRHKEPKNSKSEKVVSQISHSEEKPNLILPDELNVLPIIGTPTKDRYTVSIKFGENIEFSSDDYKEAVTRCNGMNKVFDSDGVKVYPPPSRRLGGGRVYKVMNNDKTHTIGSYNDFQTAINHCPINYNIIDPFGDIVY